MRPSAPNAASRSSPARCGRGGGKALRTMKGGVQVAAKTEVGGIDPVLPLLGPVPLDRAELPLRRFPARARGRRERRRGRSAVPGEGPERQSAAEDRDSPHRGPRPRGPAEPFARGDSRREHHHHPPPDPMTHSGRPWRLKQMTPGSVRERLLARPTLIVPVGTTEQHGPHLPLGCDTIIVEHLADDLSASHGVSARRRWSTASMLRPAPTRGAPRCEGARCTV